MTSASYDETALFVTPDKASEMCAKASDRLLNLSEATYHMRRSRGAILGYEIRLKFRDGAAIAMSEAHAEKLG